MDYKNFTLAELKNRIENLDINFRFDDKNENKIKNLFNTEKITISDHVNLYIQKGSENLYFDIDIYLLENDFFGSSKLTIYSKDSISELKKLISEIIEQI